MLKKAMIMAAGVGSRLGALSDMIPKPIVPLVNVPAMDIIVKHLSSFGIKNIIANTYHKADDIKERYANNEFNVDFEFITETTLSGTAGGVKKCQFFFDKDEDFIVMSGDGLCDIDIKKAYDSHKKSGAIATLVLKEVDIDNVNLYGIVVTDKQGFVDSFQEKPKTEEAKSNLANTGIYIFNYRIFDYIPQNTFFDFAKNVFPALLNNNEKINTFRLDGYWSDIGSIEQYKQSNFDLLHNKLKNYIPKTVKTNTALYATGENTKIAQNAQITGNCVIGNNCTIEDGAKVINSVLWDNITVKSGMTIDNSIVLSNLTVDKNIKDIVLFEQKSTVSV